MNTNTAKAIEKFCDEVAALAEGTVHLIGSSKAGEIIHACIELKQAIKTDETITETK